MTSPVTPEDYRKFVEGLTHTERLEQRKKFDVIRRSGAWRTLPHEEREAMLRNATTLDLFISSAQITPTTPIVPTDTGHPA